MRLGAIVISARGWVLKTPPPVCDRVNNGDVAPIVVAGYRQDKLYSLCRNDDKTLV